MRFIVKRDSSKDIEVCGFEILDRKKEGFLEKMKPLALTAIASSAITAVTCFYFLSEALNVDIHRKNEMSISIEKANEPERNRAGTDGITATINGTSQDTQGKD